MCGCVDVRRYAFVHYINNILNFFSIFNLLARISMSYWKSVIVHQLEELSPGVNVTDSIVGLSPIPVHLSLEKNDCLGNARE
jgi:hypothetical protein